jgi:hypothetical protein
VAGEEEKKKRERKDKRKRERKRKRRKRKKKDARLSSLQSRVFSLPVWLSLPLLFRAFRVDPAAPWGPLRCARPFSPSSYFIFPTPFDLSLCSHPTSETRFQCSGQTSGGVPCFRLQKR